MANAWKRLEEMGKRVRGTGMEKRRKEGEKREKRDSLDERNEKTV